MGDSETECSQMEAECDSPILYSAQTAGTAVHFQPSQFQCGDSMLALSQLDSLLEYPASQMQTDNTQPARTTVVNPVSGTKVVQKTPAAAKARSLDQVMQQLSKFTVNKANLMHYLDASDMKLLIFAAGDRVNSKATKGTMCDVLLQLIQQGSLNKYCTAMNLPMVHVSCNISAPLVRQPSMGFSETQMETRVETQLETHCESFGVYGKSKQVAEAPSAPLPQPKSTASIAPPAPASLPPKVLFVMDDPSLWAPVRDEEMLQALGEAPKSAAVSFAPLPKHSAVYFPDAVGAVWQPCDDGTPLLPTVADCSLTYVPTVHDQRCTGMQTVLNETDPAYVSKCMLQRLHNTEGVFSALRPKPPSATDPKDSGNSLGSSSEATYDLSDLPNKPSGSDASDTERVPPTSTLKATAGHAEVMDSLRKLLLSSAAPTALASTIRPPAEPDTASVATNRSAVAIEDSLSKYDSIKLATFRHAKLGLTLVREVGAAGQECIVVQAKAHGQLDAAIDKLLSVGDMLVSINHTEVRRCGTSFSEQLAYLRELPRPVLLGFVPAIAAKKM